MGVIHPAPAYALYVERSLDEETQTFYAKNQWPAMRGSQDLSGQNISTIAQFFGVGNYCTVSKTIDPLNEVLAHDGEVPEHFNSISKDLTP